MTRYVNRKILPRVHQKEHILNVNEHYHIHGKKAVAKTSDKKQQTLVAQVLAEANPEVKRTVPILSPLERILLLVFAAACMGGCAVSTSKPSDSGPAISSADTPIAEPVGLEPVISADSASTVEQAPQMVIGDHVENLYDIQFLRDENLSPGVRFIVSPGYDFEVYLNNERMTDLRVAPSWDERTELTVILPTQNSGQVTSVKVVFDNEGEQYVWEHQFTIRGYKTESVTYDGVRGERIFEQYGELIEDHIQRLHEQGIEGWLFIRDRDGFGADSYGYINAGCFIDEGDIGVGIAAIYHEFGHKKYYQMAGSPRQVLREMCDVYWEVMEQPGLIDTFKDSNFVSYSEAGHPQSNESELFASAYMISQLHRDEYNSRFYEGLDEEQRALVDRVFEIVTRPLEE